MMPSSSSRTARASTVHRLLPALLASVLALGQVGCGTLDDATAAPSRIDDAPRASSGAGEKTASKKTAGGAERPAPFWVGSARTRADHLLHLDKHSTLAERRAAEEGGTVERRLLDTLDHLLDTFTLAGGRARIEARLLRTLPSGLFFDSLLELSIRTEAENGDANNEIDPANLVAELELRITHANNGAASSESPNVVTETYGGRLEGHHVRELRSHDGPSPMGFDQRELHPNLPLSLGDLPLADLLGLRAALLDGNVDDLGELALGRSQFLRVIEIRFPPYLLDDERPPETDYTTRGASALLYIDAQRMQPRALRIFDRAGRLVRIYDHLVYAEPRSTEPRHDDLSELRLQSIQVQSVTDGSYSTFLLGSLDTSPETSPETHAGRS